jgi:hypothetical protein
MEFHPLGALWSNIVLQSSQLAWKCCYGLPLRSNPELSTQHRVTVSARATSEYLETVIIVCFLSQYAGFWRL